MENENGFIAIPLIILALLGITIGIGYAIQRQSKDVVITAQNENIISSGTTVCQCDVSKEDILTKEDILKIIIDNKELLKGDKGDRGEKGSNGIDGLSIQGPKGEQGPQGERGPQGPKGDIGSTLSGYYRRFCISDGNVEPYPKNVNVYVYGSDRLPGEPSSPIYKDYCERKPKGTITYLWIVSEEKREYAGGLPYSFDK